MNRPLLFIHGLFMTGHSWSAWLPQFEKHGYRCLTPDWPLHSAEPAILRAHLPSGFGGLGLDAVMAHVSSIAEKLGEKPILIGHGVGGLIVQQLVSRDLAAAGVCIASVAPNAMLGADWEFYRTATTLGASAKDTDPYILTKEIFHERFANTMAAETSDAAYEAQVVPGSRSVLRACMGEAGRIEGLDGSHVPLLFINGDQDRILPDKLGQKNARAWSHDGSVVEFHEFPGRGHFICGELGWQDIARRVEGWLLRHAPPPGGGPPAEDSVATVAPGISPSAGPV
jgi:pimeloyl-ACP methyl ester carboxylesterase